MHWPCWLIGHGLDRVMEREGYTLKWRCPRCMRIVAETVYQPSPKILAFRDAHAKLARYAADEHLGIG